MYACQLVQESLHYAPTLMACYLPLKKKVEEVGDATFEKMGELMHHNSNRILGMYDELTTFLTQLNVYQGKGLSNSYELALFLQLYNGHAWTRNTGTYALYS